MPPIHGVDSHGREEHSVRTSKIEPCLGHIRQSLAYGPTDKAESQCQISFLAYFSQVGYILTSQRNKTDPAPYLNPIYVERCRRAPSWNCPIIGGTMWLNFVRDEACLTHKHRSEC
jgi:hypothetical protein